MRSGVTSIHDRCGVHYPQLPDALLSIAGADQQLGITPAGRYFMGWAISQSARAHAGGRLQLTAIFLRAARDPVYELELTRRPK